MTTAVPTSMSAAGRAASNGTGWAVTSRVVIYGLLIFFALVYLIPLFVMLVTSFKTMDEIQNGNMLSLPKDPTFDPWVRAWGETCVGLTCAGIKGYFWNSIKMVVPAVAISTMLGALNGYVLTKWRFRGHKVVFGLMLFACFIPFQSVLLPMATILGALGRFGNTLQDLVGFSFGFGNPTVNLVFVHVVYGLGFTTLFFRNYYEAFPTELVRAAQMDGANFFQIFWRILLPSSTPIIVVTVIYQFTNIWNDFLFASAYAGSGDVMPMTVALNNVVNTSTGVVEYNVNMAAAMIAALPTLLVYVLAGRYFVRGLMAGAVKG
jgi:glucose/mannose transport system permease protein